MSIFSIFQRPDMNDGVEQARQTPGALLLDVRTPEEYAAGHVPGSRNIPLDCVGQAELDREVPLFVYCRSGARSGQACSILRERGYDATNIGGILHYEGTLEQGGQQV